MKITRFISATIGISMFVLPSWGKKKEQHKPNVILINVDDMGFGDCGCYGATKVNTPNIDRLASEGARFTDAHSASSVSTPSRYSLLTGQYACRNNLWGPIFLHETLKIDTARTTIADVMKHQGYSTAIIGKWHLGFQLGKDMDWNKELKPGPLECGFDYFYGIPTVSSHPPFVYVENHHVVGYDPKDPFVYGKKAETAFYDEKMGIDDIGGATAAHKLYKDNELGTVFKDKAITWIKRHKGEPFFLYYATTHLHHPFAYNDRFKASSTVGRYGDYIHELDYLVGEIMKTLDDEGLRENTLVIFTSDNGPMLNRGGQEAWQRGHHMNGDLLGFKFDAWEGGHRIPFIVRWPGKIEAGTVSDQLICNVDIMAFLATLTGYELKDDEAPDSYDIYPIIMGQTKKEVRDHLVLAPSHKSHLAIRQGDWMYIPALNGGGVRAKNVGDHTFGGVAAFKFTHQSNLNLKDEKGKLPKGQLYNLKKDPQQKVNVYVKYPKKVMQMDKLLKDKMQHKSTRKM